VDSVIIAASAKDAAPVSVATEISRGRGRIVVLGDIRLDLDRRVFYEKELRLVVSRSYGPGRYDRDYEEKGIDYPYEYVRWTLKRNMGAFLALAPRLRIEPLISHRFTIEEADPVDALGEDTDLVVIATRHSQHAGLVKEALGRGKAVFVEKPLCTSDDELEEVRSAYARSSRPFLMVGYNRRFAPLVARLRTSLGPV